MSRNPAVRARAFAAILRLAVAVTMAAVVAVPASALTVRGTVHTETPGATLTVRVWARERGGDRVGMGFDPSTTGRTDERGEFRVEGVRAGELDLVASAQGYRRTVLPVTVPEDGAVPVVTVAIARGLNLRGWVVDGGGQPIPGIWVFAQAADRELLGATVTVRLPM